MITSMYEILSIHLHIHSSYSTLATLGIMKLAFLYTRKAGTDDRRLVPQHIGHMLHANFRTDRHVVGADAAWSSITTLDI